MADMIKKQLGLDGGVKGRILDCITESAEVFAKNYLGQFKVSLVKKMMADGVKESAPEEKHPRQLKELPGDVMPTKEGFVEKQSSVLKRWKKVYFKVKPNFDISVQSAADKPEDTFINLWGYKAGKLNERPQGKRKGGPKWVEDDSRAECKACSKAFTMTSRRHHCRGCGEIFCGDCTGDKVDLPQFGYEEPQRVCVECNAKYNARSRAMSIMLAEPGKNPEDQKEYFWGIQLLHKTRVPYVFCLESEAERDDWLSILTVCCKQARLPTNENPVMADAFNAAHRETSWEFRKPGPWAITGTEAEMLGELITHNLEVRVIDKEIQVIISKVPEGFRKKAIGMLRRQVSILVGTAVAPAWKRICKSIEDVQKPIEEKLGPVFGKVESTRVEMKNKIKGGIMKGLTPVLDKVVAPILNKVIIMAQTPPPGPLLDSYSQMFKVFKKEMTQLAERVKGASDKKAAVHKEAIVAMKNVRSEWWAMWDVYTAAREFGNQLRQARREHEQLSHIDVTALVDQLLISVHSLQNRAIYTLSTDEQLLEALAGGADAEGAVFQAYQRTSNKLLHDSYVEVLDVLNSLLKMIVMPPVRDALEGNAEISAVTDGLDDLIPDFAKEFLSIKDTRDEIVDDVLTDAIAQAVDKGTTVAKTRLFEGMSKA